MFELGQECGLGSRGRWLLQEFGVGVLKGARALLSPYLALKSTWG